MKTIFFSGLTLGMSLALVSAQLVEPSEKEKEQLIEQAEVLFTALAPAVENVSSSTVEVRVWRNRVGYGTVVEPGKVLTKWSEVRRDLRSLSCRTGDGKWLPAQVSGVYVDADLAILAVPELKAKPVVFADDQELKLGSFLAIALESQ